MMARHFTKMANQNQLLLAIAATQLPIFILNSETHSVHKYAQYCIVLHVYTYMYHTEALTQVSIKINFATRILYHHRQYLRYCNSISDSSRRKLLIGKMATWTVIFQPKLFHWSQKNRIISIETFVIGSEKTCHVAKNPLISLYL